MIAEIHNRLPHTCDKNTVRTTVPREYTGDFQCTNNAVRSRGTRRATSPLNVVTVG